MWMQFWPTTANGWLPIISTVATVVGAVVVSLIIKPLRKEIGAEEKARQKQYDEIRDKMQGAIDKAHAAIGRIDLLQRNVEISSAECSDMQERVGRNEGRIETMLNERQAMELRWLGAMGEIRERLKGIETEMHLIRQQRDTK